MQVMLWALCLAGAAAVTPVLAAGGGGAGGADESVAVAREVTEAVAAIKAGQFAAAIGILRPYVARVRDDADGHNWLAYAYRKSGQLEPAFVHYQRALAIEPAHLGAHEYIGEAYLLAGKPADAQKHLRELERLCQARCEQYEDLKQAIARHAAGAVVATPGR
jgi:Flp pilus assembly protein TadD